MIDIILKIIDLFYRAIYYLLFVCYYIGNFLSVIGYYLFWGTCQVISTIFMLIQILLEDFSSFGIDIFQNLSTAASFILEKLELCYYFIGYVLNYLTYVPHAIIGLFALVISAIQDIIVKCLNCVIHILCTIKQVLINIGDGVWYAILIIPRSVNFILNTLLNEVLTTCGLFGDGIQAFARLCSNTLQIIYQELQEFNITTVIGLFIFTVAIYFFMQHKQSVWRFTQNILKSPIVIWIWILRFIYLIFLQGFKEICRWTHNQRVMIQLQHYPDVHDTEIPEAKLCVVCRIQEKTIILYPCKHICMCRQCFMTLHNSQNHHCPVCRRGIRKFDRIYYT